MEKRNQFQQPVQLGFKDGQYFYRGMITNSNTSAETNMKMLTLLPLQNTVKDMNPEFEEHIRLLELDNIPITANDIRNSSKRDSNIVKTMQLINNDCWEGSEHCSSLKPYYLRRDELNIDEGCLIWGNRVVIPNDLRSDILDQLQSNLSKKKTIFLVKY